MWTPPDKIRHAIPPARWPSAEEAAASRWFSAIDVGPCRLHARTWVPAMVPWRASDDGRVTPDVIAWYARFAAGEPGALVVEATGIRDVPSGPLLRIGDDRFVSGLAELVAAVRAASGAHPPVHPADRLPRGQAPPAARQVLRPLLARRRRPPAAPRRRPRRRPLARGARARAARALMSAETGLWSRSSRTGSAASSTTATASW
ncbi:hypothetical protein [Nannocystis pusilla]|uniref:hypothetical protein n=1 Tax=Nannocystis pusilla TaxID=889268 RepID=UPI003B825C98